MAQGFLIAPGTSAEELARRRQLAEAMLQEGMSTAPIQHWTQGLSRLAKGLVGGYKLGEMRQESEAERKEARSLLNSLLGLPSGAAAQPGQPASGNGYQKAPGSLAKSLTGRIVSAESGGSATATNPRSSATGAGQFIDSTWLDVLKRNRPDLAQGKTDQQLLAMRTDPNLSRQMIDAYSAENAAKLDKAGFEPTDGNTYLAHFAGPAGARAILSANPQTPVGQVLGQNVVQANPFLANMSAGDLIQWANQKMGGGATAQPQTSAQPQAGSSPLGISRERAQLIGRLSQNRHTAPLANKMLELALTPQKAQTGRYKYEKGVGILDSATGEIVRPDSPEQAARASRGDAPSGYRWTQQGALEAIPGGPATKVSGGDAARLAAMQTAEQSFQGAKDFFAEMGYFGDRINKVLNRGDAGRAERTVRLAVESALRAMTGAAAPESEVESYMDMFGPSVWDTPETISDKLSRLESFIGNAKANLMQGRGGVPQTPNRGAKTDKVLKYNRQSGKFE